VAIRTRDRTVQVLTRTAIPTRTRRFLARSGGGKSPGAASRCCGVRLDARQDRFDG
jgi:hypothetical protein